MSVRRGASYIASCELVDPNNRPARISGVTFAASDVQVSQDGGSFANIGTLPTEIGSTGRYKLVLTAAEMNASWVHIILRNSQIDDKDLYFPTDGSPAGTIVSNAGNTASTFKTDRTEATSSYWNTAYFGFTTGALAGQIQAVTGYDGTTKFVTFTTPFTGTPSPGDRFIFINI